MITIENVSTAGWEPAIRGMRNPLNSWDKSDSYVDQQGNFILGEKDYDLAFRLACAGSVHAKFRRMIMVYADITAPMYWWAEMDTYKVGTVRNSCSKMHKLLSKPFEVSDFSFEYLPGFKNEPVQERPTVDESKEIWKPYDNLYFVSNYGRVKRDDHFLNGVVHSDGYVVVNFAGKVMMLHRVVAELFVDNPLNKPFVNHKDGNKQNNTADNLEWVTQKENAEHSQKNHFQPNPTKFYSGKFSAEEREAIKQLVYNKGMSRREVAKEYGVSHTCICDIVNDKYEYKKELLNAYEVLAKPLVCNLNYLRKLYLYTIDEKEKKDIWYKIIQLLPESYNQRSTLMLNYETLANIYESRKGHKLNEWNDVTKWIETLPYSSLITTRVNSYQANPHLTETMS